MLPAGKLIKQAYPCDKHHQRLSGSKTSVLIWLANPRLIDVIDRGTSKHQSRCRQKTTSLVYSILHYFQNVQTHLTRCRGARYTLALSRPEETANVDDEDQALDLREEFHQERVEEQTRDNDSVEQQRGLPPLRHVGRVAEYDKTLDHGTTEICRASRSPTAILGM